MCCPWEILACYSTLVRRKSSRRQHLLVFGGLFWKKLSRLESVLVFITILIANSEIMLKMLKNPFSICTVSSLKYSLVQTAGSWAQEKRCQLICNLTLHANLSGFIHSPSFLSAVLVATQMRKSELSGGGVSLHWIRQVATTTETNDAAQNSVCRLLKRERRCYDEGHKCMTLQNGSGGAW
jgi:hypothetical protein